MSHYEHHLHRDEATQPTRFARAKDGNSTQCAAGTSSLGERISPRSFSATARHPTLSTAFADATAPTRLTWKHARSFRSNREWPSWDPEVSLAREVSSAWAEGEPPPSLNSPAGARQFWDPLGARAMGRRQRFGTKRNPEHLPGPAAGRHHCRWSRSGGRPASTTLTSRYACDPKAAAACNPLCGRAPVHRAKRALAESHRLRRQRRYRAGATRGRSRPSGHPKSTTPGPPSFPPWSASDRS